MSYLVLYDIEAKKPTETDGMHRTGIIGTSAGKGPVLGYQT